MADELTDEDLAKFEEWAKRRAGTYVEGISDEEREALDRVAILALLQEVRRLRAKMLWSKGAPICRRVAVAVGGLQGEFRAASSPGGPAVLIQPFEWGGSHWIVVEPDPAEAAAFDEAIKKILKKHSPN